MGENKDYMTHPDEMGCIHISEDVLASIAAGAAAEVEGHQRPDEPGHQEDRRPGRAAELGGQRRRRRPVRHGPLWLPHPRGGRKDPKRRVLRRGGHDRLPGEGCQTSTWAVSAFSNPHRPAARERGFSR